MGAGLFAHDSEYTIPNAGWQSRMLPEGTFLLAEASTG